MKAFKYTYTRYLFLLQLLFFIPSILLSQNVKVINDLRSRTSLGITKELFNKLETFGEIEIGFEENIRELGKLHAEAGIAYSPFKILDIGAKYRFTKNRKNYSDEYKYTQLIALSAEAKYKIDRLKLYYRLQYQTIDDDAISFQQDNTNRNIFKNRLKLKYNLKKTKLNPFISSEIYAAVGINGMDATKLKTLAGFEYAFTKHHEIKLYYRNDKELTNYIPYTYHTLGFSYTYNL